MLQFNKSETTNTNAVWVQTVNTSSNYYEDLVVVLSQSLDNSATVINVSVTSAPNQYRNWLVISNSGSSVPVPSGQYDVTINKSTTDFATWNEVNTAWNSYDEIWETAGDEVPGVELYADRAFVSGSNEDSITQYLSPNENGTYTTYNG